MSALANFTTQLPWTAATSAHIPVIVDSPFGGFRHHDVISSSSVHPMHLRRHRHRKNRTGSDEDEGEDERDKKRRSLNIPEHGKAKELRLFNTRQNTFVQIDNDGTVRTSPQPNSIHSIFEVLFWCHLAPQLFQPCSNSPSSFSAILMRFKATDRYLCMSHSGKIYTQNPGDSLSNVENCIFQHEFLSNQYDVYYSWRYPNGTLQCDRSPGGSSDVKRTCQNRWYLGVDKKGRLSTVKSPRTKLKRNTFFIQRWIHDQTGQGRPEYPNPLVGSTADTPPLTEGGGGNIFKISSVKPRASSVFDILLQKRRSDRNRVTSAELTSNRRDCLNLLKKCDRRQKEGRVQAPSGPLEQGPPPSTARKRRGLRWEPHLEGLDMP